MNEEEFLNMHPSDLVLLSYRIHPAPLDAHIRRELECSQERCDELIKKHTIKWMNVIASTKRGIKTIKKLLGINLRGKSAEDIREIQLKMTEANDYDVINGRPLDFENDRAPSYHNDLLRACYKEYRAYQIVDAIKYLISDTPIDKKFWYRANYSDLEFEYKGEPKRMITNHGMEACMNAVFRGELDISDWILDLTCMLGLVMKKPELLAFRDEIRDRTENGIVRYAYENDAQLKAILSAYRAFHDEQEIVKRLSVDG